MGASSGSPHAWLGRSFTERVGPVWHVATTFFWATARMLAQLTRSLRKRQQVVSMFNFEVLIPHYRNCVEQISQPRLSPPCRDNCRATERQCRKLATSIVSSVGSLDMASSSTAALLARTSSSARGSPLTRSKMIPRCECDRPVGPPGAQALMCLVTSAYPSPAPAGVEQWR
jgi:hypothetical protein